jgi:hypothetical protein
MDRPNFLNVEEKDVRMMQAFLYLKKKRTELGSLTRLDLISSVDI